MEIKQKLYQDGYVIIPNIVNNQEILKKWII